MHVQQNMIAIRNRSQILDVVMDLKRGLARLSPNLYVMLGYVTKCHVQE